MKHRSITFLALSALSLAHLMGCSAAEGDSSSEPAKSESALKKGKGGSSSDDKNTKPAPAPDEDTTCKLYPEKCGQATPLPAPIWEAQFPIKACDDKAAMLAICNAKLPKKIAPDSVGFSIACDDAKSPTVTCSAFPNEPSPNLLWVETFPLKDCTNKEEALRSCQNHLPAKLAQESLSIAIDCQPPKLSQVTCSVDASSSGGGFAGPTPGPIVKK
jgi:hypothetical protein